MPPPVQLSQIPTLSDLYRDGTLEPASQETSIPTPSATLNAKVSLIRKSITTLATTCIVNAANTSLLGGGGVVRQLTTPHLVSLHCHPVAFAKLKGIQLTIPYLQDGAIHAAAGPSLLSECRALNGCSTGSAKITSAYDLPSSYVIHAVGPIYNRHARVADKLQSCYRTSLELALEKGKETGQDASIAFSCLSTGVYGYPSGEAAEIAAGEVRRFLEELENKKQEGKTEGGLGRVVFCIFEAKDEKAYGKWLPYVLAIYLRSTIRGGLKQKKANLFPLSSKIFPPTPQDLPAKEEEAAESETTEEAPAVSKDPTTTNEPQSKKLSTSTDELDKDDWETVEKSEINEECEKVEAVEVGGSDGEETEKPIVEKHQGEPKTGAVRPENMLAKDW